MGIAEQDMISTAAGLASTGKTVFVNTFAVFLTGRAYDQIRQQVALPEASVIVCGSSAGLTQGPDGATHQSVTDINLMRGLPNMQVYVPADAGEAERIIEFAAKQKKPAYIRLSRYSTPQLIPDGIDFEAGKMQKLSSGADLAVICSGPILHHAIGAVEKLKTAGINATLYNCPSIKPIDGKTIKEISADYSKVFTVEEHNIIGGLGSAVAEVISEISNNSRAALYRLGVNDCFGESGSADELLKKFLLDADGIEYQIRQKLTE
jgi:transketolase